MADFRPTVFVLASLFSTQGPKGSYVDMSEGTPATGGGTPAAGPAPEETTRVVVIGNDADPLPPAVAREVAARVDGITSADIRYLREWLRERSVCAPLWTNAVRYLAEMQRENMVFAAAKRRIVDADRLLTLYEGGQGLYWIGNNDARTSAFLTRKGETREIRHGRPLRLRPGDVFSIPRDGRYLSGEFVVDQGGGANFIRAQTPPAVAERTLVDGPPERG